MLGSPRDCISLPWVNILVPNGVYQLWENTKTNPWAIFRVL